MKVLLVKRLDSSFYAFKLTLERFISSYEKFIKMFDQGIIYLSKKYNDKMFDLLDNDNIEGIMNLVEEEKIRAYKVDEFNKAFLTDLNNDLKILNEIKNSGKM